jgi:hypothetical protein
MQGRPLGAGSARSSQRGWGSAEAAARTFRATSLTHTHLGHVTDPLGRGRLAAVQQVQKLPPPPPPPPPADAMGV